ncbi:MAG: PTS sugar transporter subunit IIA [Pseudomonadota bacterium]
MIGLVIVTHGGLADEFLAAVEHIVGPQRQLVTISIGPEDDLEARRRDIQNAVTEVSSGDGVIVLTDMFGGTPSNLAISIMREAAVEVIAGVNLPMLVKLASIRDRRALADVTEQACDAGRKYINVASEVLGRSAAG